jgi:hypothetical protein
MNREKSLDKYKAMLEMGVVVLYGETVIDMPIEEVWAVIPEYYKWSPGHAEGTRTTLKGKPGEVGEIIKITGKQTLYAETLRIYDLHAIEGFFRAASIAFKVYDEPFSFCIFSDMTVREFDGKTSLWHGLYIQYLSTNEEFVNARKELAEGRDILAPDVTLMNGQIADYIRKRRSSTTQQ